MPAVGAPGVRDGRRGLFAENGSDNRNVVARVQGHRVDSGICRVRSGRRTVVGARCRSADQDLPSSIEMASVPPKCGSGLRL